MSKTRSWSDDELRTAVAASKSYRAVLIALGLVPAGGNYTQLQYWIKELRLDITHFTGQAWNKGMKLPPIYALTLDKVLVKGSRTQSFVLKKRLFLAGIKRPMCELCGWAEKSSDGRVPVELDHINGDHYDNRIENLRVLCPNCHSLQLTHRGRNKKTRLTKLRADVVTGSQD